MTPTEAALALALLASPGPTNTLLAIAGAERGWTRALRLTPAVLGAYLATTVPLAVLGASLLDSLPTARAAITLAAAAWVLWLAVAMWRVSKAQAGGLTVTARRVAVTTLLNPKALVLGLALLPAGDWARLGLNFTLLAAQALAVSLAWAALGAALRRPDAAQAGLPTRWRRAASVWLGALAVYLLGRVAGLA